MFLAACLLPLIGLSGYSIWHGKPHDAALDIEVLVGYEPIELADGRGAILADSIVLTNPSAHPLPNVTVEINGQYFLYCDSAIQPGERLVLPQSHFTTKSNRRWVPGRQPIESVTVTAKLPSGKRGVRVLEFPSASK